MKPEIKEKWVEALRSGNYQQGTYRLRKKDNTFCCLGVLCDIIDSSSWSLSEPDDSYSYDTFFLGLSESMEKFVELENRHASLLASMNDNGSSFKAIADYIEENL